MVSPEKANTIEIEPIHWDGNRLLLLDQTQLPHASNWIAITCVEEAIRAIQKMQVRGAPAIGVSAAYAMALAAKSITESSMQKFLKLFRTMAANLANARPTAINLQWAIQRCLEVAATCSTPANVQGEILLLAHQLKQSDIETNKKIGNLGSYLIPESGGVLTHCNTGALATAGYGTALGVIRSAWNIGKRPRVFCTETRPWLQGSRLTAWELVHMGIPAQLIIDSAAGWLMSNHEVDLVIIGADRIAANGDTANKIGSYSLAILAKEHGIPFYVAAPRSTIDLSTTTGNDIVVEERPEEEITTLNHVRIAADGIGVRNPSFDVTPADYITAIITEYGVLERPYSESLPVAWAMGARNSQ